MSKASDYRVIVGIDFGTTHSGFAYTHVRTQLNEIITHTDWQDYAGRFKVPTVLLYDDDLKSVQSWGFSALAKRPKRKKVIDKKPVELFKLHLGKMSNKPPLPNGLDYKKAITDYLHEFGKVVKNKIDDCWKVNFFTQVLFIFTIPTEFDDNAISIMRECIFKAGLLKDQYARNLRFITGPEAAAIHCMKYLKEHNLSVGANFMIVDCGGGTVDLTISQLLEGETLSEIIEGSGGYCGGNFVDQEFLKFLESKVGANAISQVRENHYCQLQYMVQEFVRLVKMKFTGDPSEFVDTELELDDICPVIKQYCKGEYLDKMEEDEWTIILKFDNVKIMFDPIVKRIIQLIDTRLHLINNNCSAILMVGGFSESKYLQSRIKQEFSSKVKLITIPPQPVSAIMKGAVKYGLMRVPYISHDEAIQSLYNEEKILQDEIHNNIKQYKLLYNKLQKRYADLTKNMEQHQVIVKKLKNENEKIKEINQTNRSKIESQEQMINQSRQTLELKENQLQNLEKEKVELDIKIESLLQKNTNLDTQLQNVVQQNALLDKEINDLNDINQKHQQRIDRSQQSLELVKNQMKNLEKEKDEEINKYKLMSDEYKEKYTELLNIINNNNEKTN
ncbi:uncharacterized protein OCT59_009912 [Rhizophagus irregularis]|uniref:Hsp70 family protein n=2 Tax=Rhizophagus irregularis TaxID=588596 RepID=U9U8K2_RHIID|nr:hypothetical protein GLOIN_2v1886005 [Rhizophagus irregularis DAOM 181602=DAOM 197198]POG58224.1 hypothetical protein GLOIN_2v1886005 [Rhizophagus irregularis DAOM 181602=DAOM 197198]UZO18600.1 hypothetical protein OCT59_009912 [Rhizophagus irregularis]GBC29314.2 hypothetical protein GLOIN_2v1886005 [Rhizophagus irregularis DAOM 181602=DAOM 197198]|eukprot:XP_025165090.1 hypothetical protein GLOIN_2v1886005 [Rhizophagus irregularis DAOM 181602=DAOM 197198]